jgi:LysM repeat protein
MRFVPMSIVGLMALVLAFYLANGLASAQGGNLLTNPGFEGQYDSYTPETPAENADCTLGICTTAQMAPGWKPWWIKERPTDVNPEYKPATRDVSGGRVRNGDRAAQYFSFWSTHKAGLRQTVTVPPNAVVQFSIWGHAWLSEADGTFVSDRAGTPNMRIGIDPTGGSNPYGQSIVWSDYIQAYDSYLQFSVQAQAIGDKVTVFTFSAPSVNPNSPEYGFKHTDIFWDDASLVVVGAGSAPVAAPAGGGGGNTSQAPAPAAPAVRTSIDPTATPDAEGIIYSEVRAGDSIWALAARAGITIDEILELNGLSRDDVVRPGDLLITGSGEAPEEQPEEEAEEPSLEETATEQVSESLEEANEEEATDTIVAETPEAVSVSEELAVVDVDDADVSICLTAYNDNNENGVLDGGESLKPAVAFTISDGRSVVSNYVTDGTNEPFCILGLNPGTYRVSRSSLPNEVMTTPGDQAVSLSGGSTLNLYFGSYLGDQIFAEEDAPTEASDTSSSDSITNNPLVMGALIASFILLIAIVLIILIGRRRATE